ncbi:MULTISPECIES: hypothetical protein [Bacillus]|nr:hypothetical protein [Bacillus cereus]
MEYSLFLRIYDNKVEGREKEAQRVTQEELRGKNRTASNLSS